MKLLLQSTALRSVAVLWFAYDNCDNSANFFVYLYLSGNGQTGLAVQ